MLCLCFADQKSDARRPGFALILFNLFPPPPPPPFFFTHAFCLGFSGTYCFLRYATTRSLFFFFFFLVLVAPHCVERRVAASSRRLLAHAYTLERSIRRCLSLPWLQSGARGVRHRIRRTWREYGAFAGCSLSSCGSRVSSRFSPAARPGLGACTRGALILELS